MVSDTAEIYCNHHWTEIAPEDIRCTKCEARLYNNTYFLPPTAVTCDFKKSTPLNNYVDVGLYDSQIDLKPSSAAVIESQMKKYSKQMDEKLSFSDQKALEKFEEYKQLKIAGAQAVVDEFKKGTQELLEKGAITPEQQKALISQKLELQQQILSEQKAQEQALLNILQIKNLQEQLNKSKMAFHDTGHIPPPPKAKPLKIAKGRKFR